ncbi:MAG: M20/M25/M40 family metallo-hydrolase [Acidimicrobiia bacterium]
MIDGSDAITLLTEMIQNACVNTGDPASGGEIRSVRTIQRHLGQTGVVIEPLPGRASVVYRHEGSDPNAPTILMIPHLDVVPASADGWTHNPYAATQADGFIWGRGAVDMLNITAAMVVVFKALRDGDLRPIPSDIILAAVADEEAGGVHGARHLVEDHWPLIACDHVLTEVAGPMIGPVDTRALPVTVAEKGPAWRRLATRGTPGHGSQPYARTNAVVALSDAIHRIATHDQPILITDEWRRFVPHLPITPELAERLLDGDTVDAAIAEIGDEDPILARWIHACTHLTLSPNVVTGGSKVNTIPDTAELGLDARLLPGQATTDVEEHLRKVLGPDLFDQISVEPIQEMPANGSPPEGLMWDAIGDAAERHTGSRALAPTLTPVSTDARFFRARGIPAYGVGLFDDSLSFPDMLGMFHGVDERISPASVVASTQFLATVVDAYGQRLIEGRFA